jgi:SAM-dependent methyltransferase
MQDNNKYLFPHPENSNENFIFKNRNFENQTNKDEKRKVLEFSENQEGWTDELTEIAHLHIDANHPIDFASRETCIEFLNQFDQSKKKVVLEIGCSNGNLIKNIIKLKKYFYIGSDAIKNRIYKLSTEYENVPFVIFDLLKNPFKKNICDVVIMLNVLEHIKDDDKALLEVNKILNNNGIFILEVPSGSFLYDEYDRKLLHYRRYNMKDIEKKLINAGFQIEKKTHLGFLVYPLFVIVKLFNKLFEDKNIVIKQANASNNFFLKILFNIEKKLRNIYLPFGIRCFICARKIK